MKTQSSGTKGGKAGMGKTRLHPQFSTGITTMAAFDVSRGVVRSMIRAHFADDSCIATAGVVVDLLRDLGIAAEAVPCHRIALNHPYMEWAAAKQRLIPLTDEEGDEAAAAGGRMVIMAGVPRDDEEVKTLAGVLCHMRHGQTQSDGEERFPGHVVVIATVDGARFLIDLSIDQVRRPQYGMNPAPVALAVTRPFFQEGDMLIVRHEDTTLIYERIDNQSFRESNNFHRVVDGDAVATTTMSELRMAATLFVASVFRSLSNNRVVRGAPPSSKVAEEVEPQVEFMATVRDLIAAMGEFKAMQAQAAQGEEVTA
mgnify:CR=1 FL=1